MNEMKTAGNCIRWVLSRWGQNQIIYTYHLWTFKLNDYILCKRLNNCIYFIKVIYNQLQWV